MTILSHTRVVQEVSLEDKVFTLFWLTARSRSDEIALLPYKEIHKLIYFAYQQEPNLFPELYFELTPPAMGGYMHSVELASLLTPHRHTPHRIGVFQLMEFGFLLQKREKIEYVLEPDTYAYVTFFTAEIELEKLRERYGEDLYLDLLAYLEPIVSELLRIMSDLFPVQKRDQ